MGRKTSPQQPLAGLRDFFMAENEDQLRQAFEAVAGSGVPGTQDMPLARDIDWEQTLFGFNRLFVGPMALQAPPFASVWLEPEPLLMGQSTLDARHVYQMLGLEAPHLNKMPDDHLSLELDALAAMETALEQGASNDLRELRRFFLERHVLRWMPRLCARVLETEDAPPAVAGMAGVLAAWLRGVQESLSSGSGAGMSAAQPLQSSNSLEVRS